MSDIFDLDGVSQVQSFASLHERLNEIEANNNVATVREADLINKLHNLINEESTPSRSRSKSSRKRGKNRNKITRRKKMGMKNRSSSKSKSKSKSKSRNRN